MPTLSKLVCAALTCLAIQLPAHADNTDGSFQTVPSFSWWSGDKSANNNATGGGGVFGGRSLSVDGLINSAKNLIGLPYRAGGTSPTSGFDCSGFVQYVFKHAANVDLPRTSRDMAQVGQSVSRDNLRPGDMVFFAHTHGGGNRISHVGVYVGEGRFIHSPSTGKTIQINSMDSGYWSSKFVTARRVTD